MRIRKVSEPFKHLSGTPVKVVTIDEAMTYFREPTNVIPITKAAGYKRANKKVANSV